MDRLSDMSASKIRIIIMRVVLSVFFAVVFSRLFPMLRKGVWAIVGMAVALFAFASLLDYAKGHNKKECPPPKEPKI